jgi:glucose/arabinose dehydrogenase
MLLRALFGLLLCAAPGIALAAGAPQFRLSPIASGIDHPVGIVDDGSGRLFIMEQAGRLRIVQNGQLVDAPFLDISSEVASPGVNQGGNECGLLGVAFHPDFKNNHRFFINYDTSKNGKLQTCIAEFTANADNTHADPSTEKDLLFYDQPFTNHKGGCIVFGPDHMLYWGAGDGGAAGDPFGNGQNLNVYLGKIMRVDVDHGSPYKVPADNPFVGRKDAKPEIWCYGMRNPWRFSFDRQTGKLWCGDVGQDLWEEVDIIEKGKDYGWSAREGKHHFKPERANGTLVDPIKDYPHTEGNCIIGGFVYRGKAIPALQGIYVYADNGRGWIAGLQYDGTNITFDQHLLESPLHPASFGEDKDGELYLCDRERGQLFMLTP